MFGGTGTLAHPRVAGQRRPSANKRSSTITRSPPVHITAISGTARTSPPAPPLRRGRLDAPPQGYGTGRAMPRMPGTGIGPTPQRVIFAPRAARIMAYKVCGPANAFTGDRAGMGTRPRPYPRLERLTVPTPRQSRADVIHLSAERQATLPHEFARSNNAAPAQS